MNKFRLTLDDHESAQICIIPAIIGHHWYYDIYRILLEREKFRNTFSRGIWVK